jgi:hypothetical protein
MMKIQEHHSELLKFLILQGHMSLNDRNVKQTRKIKRYIYLEGTKKQKTIIKGRLNYKRRQP